jgi:L,D-peptidoglycan transpeptidase YkuD (ErfK/YbiS/YcfS/YnhG family)
MADLIVTADPSNPQRGHARLGAQTYACVLGRSGIRADKHEGDGATPTGCYALLRVLYRSDRVPALHTPLPSSAIARDDGWCDAPADAAYNTPVKLPYAASAEEMWREDHVYDVVVVTSHNADPVKPFAGSAIFLHVAAANGDPTAGCIAFAREDLLKILESATAVEIRG